MMHRLPIDMLEYFKKEIIPLKNKLFRYAKSFVSNENEAEDIVQDVFMKIWIKRSDLKDINNIEAWSMTLTRNLSLDRLKKNRFEFVGQEILVKNQSKTGTPHTLYERNETHASIHKMINSLSVKQKQVIMLRDIEGHSYREIGEIMGIDENLVKVTLFRARENMRKKILNTEHYEL